MVVGFFSSGMDGRLVIKCLLFCTIDYYSTINAIEKYVMYFVQGIQLAKNSKMKSCHKHGHNKLNKRKANTAANNAIIF